MNYKKGLVALAITGALATPLAANAANLKVYGGQLTPAPTPAGQFGPQTDSTNTTGVNTLIPAGDIEIGSDFLTVDKIRAGLEVDLDANEQHTVAGSFVGSNREDVSFSYASVVSIPNEATYEFVVTGNGGISENNILDVVFVAQVADANGSGFVANNDFVEIGGVIDYVADAQGVVKSFKIQIDTNVEFLDGIFFVSSLHDGNPLDGLERTPLGTDPRNDSFKQSEAIPANTQLFLALKPTSQTDGSSTSAGNSFTYNPLVLKLNNNASAGDEVFMQVTEVTNTAGLPLNQLTTNDEKVLEVTDGFQLTVVDQATNIIEVENNRASFVDCENGSNSFGPIGDETVDGSALVDYVCGSSNRIVSRAKLMFNSAADVGLDINDASSMSFTLSRPDGEPVSGVASVNFGGTPTTKNIADEYKGTGTLGTIGLMDTAGNNLEANLDITADGVNPMFPNTDNAADWVLSGVSITGGNLGTATVNVDVVYGETNTLGGIVREDSMSVKEDGVTHVWDIDGAQFKAPYLYHIGTASSDWSSLVIVTNEYRAEARIEADIIVKAASDVTGGVTGNTFTGVELPEVIPADGQYKFSGATLIEAINTHTGTMTLDPAMNWHIEATFLVSAPQNYVHAAAQNTSPSGRADTPILYKTNNNADGRQWQ